MSPGISVWLELVVDNTQKANALSVNHCPPNLEGDACKCQRLRQIVPTRPSVKCQRCVVGLNSGFGDGRGSHVRTAVDILIQHHARISFEISFMPDAILLVYFEPKRLRGSLHLCGITYRAFLGLGSWAPNWKHIHEPPVLRATHNSRTSAFVHILSLYQRRRHTLFTQKKRTRYRVTTMPGFSGAFAS